MLSEIDYLAKECAEVLDALPEYPEVDRGAFRISKGFSKAGSSNNGWYNPRTARIMYIENPTSIEYPALEEYMNDRWAVWMSASPMECLSMKSHAKAASGHVLIGGLGLGILAWLCASKPLVKSVTVVELRQEVIDLVLPVIAHPKIAVVNGDIWGYVDTTKERYDFISLDIWQNLGNAILDAFPAKERAARALKRGGSARTWLDEIANRLSRTDALAKSAERARRTRGKMLDEPKMVGDRACDFCGAKPFIDCYGFCPECFVNLGICQAAGQEVFDKMLVFERKN